MGNSRGGFARERSSSTLPAFMKSTPPASPPISARPREASDVLALSLDEVRTTATLARLHLTDEEAGRMAQELSSVLGHARALASVDVQGVVPMTYPVAMRMPLRADVIGPHDDIETALRNAPATEATFFTVPAILPGSADEE